MLLRNQLVKKFTNTHSFFRIKEQHQFHLVNNSQLPIVTALSAMLIAMGLVFYWHPSEGLLGRFDNFILHLGCVSLTFVIISWMISIVRESQAGNHTRPVQAGLRFGFILFIVSEVLFFFAFFWAFFHYSLVPTIEIDATWPPKGMQAIDPWGLPLVNTLLLLSSGITLTHAHASLIHAECTDDIKSYNKGSSKFFIKSLAATIILGITFLVCQGIEYKYGLTFSWHDTVYGSIFYLTTGFHGFHVTLGTFGLCFCLIRALITLPPITKLWKRFYINPPFLKLYRILIFIKLSATHIYKCFIEKNYRNILPEIKTLFKQINRRLHYKTVLNAKAFLNWLATFGFSPQQHLGFEAAAWYWHFVDVVWLFLFATVYVWGN